MNTFLQSMIPYPWNFGALQRARGVAKDSVAEAPCQPKAPRRNLPVVINPAHALRFEKILEAPTHTIYTHSYENGWVTRDGSHINRENRLIAEISLHYRQTLENHSALTKKRLVRPTHAHQGNLLSLAGLGYYNYYHWMMEHLPKIYLAQKQGLGNGKDWTLYAPTVHPAQADSLRHVSTLPILENQNHPTVRAANIWGATPTSAVLEPSPWVVDWLREQFLGLAESAATPAKVFLNRTNTKSRRIENIEELRTSARKHGFIEVTLEGKSLAQQVAIFKNAKEVLAPHGAGLTNLAFCQKDTLILELLGDSIHRPEKQTETCFWALANLRACNYGSLECKTIPTQDEAYDLEVKLEELEALYKKMRG